MIRSRNSRPGSLSSTVSEPSTTARALPCRWRSQSGAAELLSPEEAELRLRLHLESIERQQRSLLAAPVAHSVRDADAHLAGDADTGVPSPQDRLANLYETLGAAAVQQTTAGTAPTAAAVPPGGQLDVPLPDSNSLPSYERPERVVAPDDPAGFHRIHEGSFVEAVLVTQLSGDFPSPVAAVVAVPYYSGDRQTVLIPRGSRFIGTAQAVRDQNQSRLAVGFHRLLFPDGRWAALRFQGLNQLGEGALKDQVDRHTSAPSSPPAASASLSGLAQAGATPTERSNRSSRSAPHRASRRPASRSWTDSSTACPPSPSAPDTACASGSPQTFSSHHPHPKETRHDIATQNPPRQDCRHHPRRPAPRHPLSTPSSPAPAPAR